jgi:ectoine hydrolase
MRKCDLVAEIYDAGIRGDADFGGDYPAIVPLLPSGRDAAAPHLTWDDKPMQAGRAPSSRSPAATTATTCRCRARSFWASRRRPSSMPKRRRWKGWRQGSPPPGPAIPARTSPRLLRRAEEIRHRQGQPHRLSDRPELSARLGRAHHVAAPRRPHRPATRHDLPFHDRPVARDMGFEITESILITETGVECLSNVPRKLFVKD